MKTGYGFGPLDPDPVTYDEVPEGKVRDFMGELVDLPGLARVSRLKDDTILAEQGSVEMEPDFTGRACLLIDSLDVGNVTYLSQTERGLELTISGSRTYGHGKILLETL